MNRTDAMSPVRAAGGVLWRRDPAGGREIVLVHRPRYDDWSLPKGKLMQGEPPLAAACREVLEETGVRPAAGARLASVAYPVRVNGAGVADKVVEYWAMRAVEEVGFTPDHEVDQVRWLAVEAAGAALTYPHDISVVDAFATLPATTGLVVLVRHASAGRRAEWSGPDAARPLDPAGAARARELADLLCWYAPDRLVSAGPNRCRQTLGPLEATLDTPITVCGSLDEHADPVAAAERLCELARPDATAVACSQGGLIPAALATLSGGDPASYHTEKGGVWVLTFTEGRFVSAEPLDG